MHPSASTTACLSRRFGWLASCLVGIAAGAAALTVTQPVSAQQQYILSEEDTWQPQRAVDPASPEGRLADAKKALAAGDAERARSIAGDWIDRYPQHPLLPEAYLIRADAKLAQGEEYNALFDYELIARSYASSEVFPIALRRELDIAKRYARGHKRKLFGMRIASADSEAEELFIRVQERMPGSRLAEEAGIELGDFYFKHRQMSLAAEAYDLFILNYPKSNHIDHAREGLIAAYLAAFKGPQFDAGGLYEARARLQQLRAQRPAEAERLGADAKLAGIDEKDAQKLLYTGRWYLRTGDPIAAELSIRRLLQKHPRSAAAADALRLMPEILPRLPKSVLEQAPDYEAMRAAAFGAGETAPTAAPAREAGQ